MIIMLNQAAGDRQILAKQLNISPHQLSYVTHSGEGEGLLFFGNVILPFVDRFPQDLELYRIRPRAGWTKRRRTVQTSERKSSKINFVDEGSETKGRAPPESQADAKKKPNPRKLKSDAQKAKERAEQLRFGKAEISVDEVSRMTKEQKAAMYASSTLATAAHRKIEEYEDDNVGLKSAHEVEKGAELAGRVSDSRYAKKLKKVERC